MTNFLKIATTVRKHAWSLHFKRKNKSSHEGKRKCPFGNYISHPLLLVCLFQLFWSIILIAETVVKSQLDSAVFSFWRKIFVFWQATTGISLPMMTRTDNEVGISVTPV